MAAIQSLGCAHLCCVNLKRSVESSEATGTESAWLDLEVSKSYLYSIWVWLLYLVLLFAFFMVVFVFLVGVVDNLHLVSFVFS